MGKDFREGQKPVKVGDKIWVEIESLGKSGDGVVGYSDSNFIIFVPETEIGKEYKIQIIKVAKNVGFGEVIRDSKRGKKDE